MNIPITQSNLRVLQTTSHNRLNDLILQITNFLRSNDITRAYTYLRTLLNISSQDQEELSAVLKILNKVLKACSLSNVERCATDELYSFLEHASPALQQELALFISQRFLEGEKLKESMEYAALALDISLAHGLESLPAETLQAEIFLQFIKTTHPKIRSTFEHFQVDRYAFLQALDDLEKKFRFCRSHHQLDHMVSLYEIAQEVLHELNPLAKKEALALCGSTLTEGLTVKKYPPLLSSRSQKYREWLSEYRKSYKRSFTSFLRQFQKEQTDAFVNFFSLIINDAFLVVGPPPCGYELCAMGSLGREEPTPFSDLEWVLLIEKEEELPYFKKWISFLELQVLSLGETPSPYIPYYPSCPKKKGFFLDRGDDPLIGTPNMLFQSHVAPLETELLIPRTMPYTLNYLRSIHGNTEGKLLSQFLQFKKDFFTKERREKHGKNLLNERVKEWKLQTKSFSIKDDYLHPLICPLSDLALLLGIEKTNVLDILEAFEEKKCFSAITFRLLNKSINLLYMLRLNSDCPPIDQEKMLKKIQQLLITPLYLVLNQIPWEKAPLIDLFEIALKSEHSSPSIALDCVTFLQDQETSLEIIKHYYMFLSQDIRSIEPFREAYLKGISNRLCYKELAFIPNPYGERQTELFKRRGFEKIVEEMTDLRPQKNEMGYTVSLIFPGKQEPLYLKKSTMNAILDLEGNIKKTCMQTNSRVTYFAYNKQSLHFKQQPANFNKESPFHPGRERAASALMFRLFGRGTSVGELMQFTVEHSQKPSKTYLVLVSETIPGNTLENQQISAKDFNPIQLSEMFLALPLLMPGDMRPANCIISPQGEEKLQLFSIDNDISWIKPLTRTRFGRFDCHFYTVLPFLFPDFILAPEAINAFLALRPAPLLLNWLESLRKYNKLIHDTFPSFSTRDFSPLCLFDRGTGGQLFVQFSALQTFLRKNQDRLIKGNEVLQTLISFDQERITDIGPIIYKKYQSVTSLNLTASEKVKRVTGRASNQSMSMSVSQAALLNQLPISTEERQEIAPEKGIEEMSVLMALHFDGFSFSQGEDKLARLEKGFKEVPDLTTQKVLLEVLALHRYTHLNLSYNKILTDIYLENFLKDSGSFLISLNLRHCPQITENSIPRIAENCPQLEELYLSHCSSIKNFANFKWRQRYFPVSFLNLHTLHITNCKMLETLQIRAPQLKMLRASHSTRKYLLELPEAASIDTWGLLHLPQPFGLAKWWKHYGSINVELPLPHNIEQILDSQCIFWPDKKVYETHLLVLIPETVNGRPFHLDTLKDLIQAPKTGYKSKYRYYTDCVKKELGIKNLGSYWILITKDVIPESRAKTYEDQKLLVQKHVQTSGIFYELPTTLEAVTAILMHYVETGKRLYSDSPLTGTRCQEKVDNNQWPVVIGCFSLSGLDIYDDWGSNNSIGVGCCRHI